MSCYRSNKAPTASYTVKSGEDSPSLSRYSTSNAHQHGKHQVGTYGDIGDRGVTEGTYPHMGSGPKMGSVFGAWYHRSLRLTNEQRECCGLAFIDPDQLLRHREKVHASDNRPQDVSDPATPFAIDPIVGSGGNHAEDDLEEHFGDLEDLTHDDNRGIESGQEGIHRETIPQVLVANAPTSGQDFPTPWSSSGNRPSSVLNWLADERHGSSSQPREDLPHSRSSPRRPSTPSVWNQVTWTEDLCAECCAIIPKLLNRQKEVIEQQTRASQTPTLREDAALRLFVQEVENAIKYVYSAREASEARNRSSHIRYDIDPDTELLDGLIAQARRMHEAVSSMVQQTSTTMAPGHPDWAEGLHAFNITVSGPAGVGPGAAEPLVTSSLSQAQRGQPDLNASQPNSDVETQEVPNGSGLVNVLLSTAHRSRFMQALRKRYNFLRYAMLSLESYDPTEIYAFVADFQHHLDEAVSKMEETNSHLARRLQSEIHVEQCPLDVMLVDLKGMQKKMARERWSEQAYAAKQDIDNDALLTSDKQDTTEKDTGRDLGHFCV